MYRKARGKLEEVLLAQKQACIVGLSNARAKLLLMMCRPELQAEKGRRYG